MKICISNIAWDKTWDDRVYGAMKKNGYSGVEIAPTRIWPEEPYEKKESARQWSKALKENWGFTIPSMQSIWYGRQEKLFGPNDDRNFLLEHTKKAIDFAVAIGSGNLVFGCPHNRNLPENADPQIALDFFKKIGDYAAEKGTVIGMEANPVIYGTNYVNDTPSAIRVVNEVDSRGFRLNLDVGTMIQNEEPISCLKGNVHLISHVHISEPMLQPIENRHIHRELFSLLMKERYQGYVSIEMRKQDDFSVLQNILEYVRNVFDPVK